MTFRVLKPHPIKILKSEDSTPPLHMERGSGDPENWRVDGVR